MELHVDPPLVDDQSDNLDFIDYSHHHPADFDHTSPETMDEEATTLNLGPHTGHHSELSYYPPASYSGANASAFGPTGTEEGEEEDDTSMSDAESDPPSADPPAFSATPHPHYAGAPAVTFHTPYPALEYSFSYAVAPAYNPATSVISDPEGLPWAPTPFHVDAADSEGLIPGTLPPQNCSLLRFLELWASSVGPYPPGRPWYPGITALAKSRLQHLAYDDLQGNLADIQGIDWVDLGVSRELARKWRLRTYKNFVNISGSDVPRVSRSVPAPAHGPPLRASFALYG